MTTTATAPKTPDAGRAAGQMPAVVEQLIQVLDDGAVAVLGRSGTRPGCSRRSRACPPRRSRQVADAAGLDERYVRSGSAGWCAPRSSSTTPAERTYALSPERDRSSPGPAPTTSPGRCGWSTFMGQVTPMVIESFRTGGRLTYATTPGSTTCRPRRARPSTTSPSSTRSSRTPASWTGWSDGIDVADVGCGEGHTVNLLGSRLPAQSLHRPRLQRSRPGPARAEADGVGPANVTFVECDVARAGDAGAYDLVTAFDAIHDQARPATVLATDVDRRCARRRLPHGRLQRVEQPRGEPRAAVGELRYAMSTMHCMSVSLGQGGAGLGTAWGVQLAERMLLGAGFAEMARRELAEDPFNAYVVARP